MVTTLPSRAIRVLVVGDGGPAATARAALDGPRDTARYQVDVQGYAEALSDAQRGRHDAYLVELDPDGRGLAMIREARLAGTSAPFIILSDRADPALEEAGVEAGATAFLVRGETDSELLRRTLSYGISQARRLATARRDQQEAEKISRAKDDFLSVVSHELRSPLSTIIGWSSLLRIKQFEPSAVLEGLQSIEISAKAQAQLVDDLMDVSRIVNGKLRLRLAALDLRDVARRAAQAARPVTEAKQQQLEIDLGDGPCPVRGDADRLHQVLTNLVSNAVKFTPEGGRIRIAVTRDGQEARIAVSDTGIGIAKGLLPRVFDRLRQASDSGTGREAGLGLGLTIARELVVLHGGKLRVHSAGKGTGATFTAELPIYERATNGVSAA